MSAKQIFDNLEGLGGFNSRLLGAIFLSICFLYLTIYVEDDTSARVEVWTMAWLSILTITAPPGPMAARSGILGQMMMYNFSDLEQKLQHRSTSLGCVVPPQGL